MKLFFYLALILGLNTALADDFKITEVISKDHNGKISSRISTGTKDGVKYYERWILEMTVSDTHPIPDSIEMFYMGGVMTFEIKRVNSLKTLLFSPAKDIFVSTHLDAPEVPKHLITITDMNKKLMFQWSEDEMGFFSKLEVKPLQ